jgi:L-lysine 2,3-aminomutase
MMNAVTTPSWQAVMQTAFRRIEPLLAFLKLNPDDCEISNAAVKDFPMLVTQRFARQMQPNNPLDPLLLQVLPHVSETETSPGFILDPMSEQSMSPVPGLIHRYHGRVLIITHGSCPIHCRFCFRRYYPYQEKQQNKNAQRIYKYIAENKSIKEVIFSGGDPFMQNDTHLKLMVDEVSNIPHIKRIRWHSRVPIVLPERMTPSLLAAIHRPHIKTIIVTHCNHPNELTELVNDNLAIFQQAGISLLNQSVLLHKINDNVDVLTSLSEKLFAHRILPYYLHTLDYVKGSHRFEVPIVEARTIHSALQEQLSGFLVPRMVKDIANLPNKVLLN